MRNGFLLLAALSGFMSVALGAFAAHGLKNVTTAEMIAIFNLGVEYQFYHTFALIAVAFAGHWLKSRLLDWAGYLFIVGTMLFSGSLYLYALLGAKWTGPITPLGGVCLLLGWLLIAVAVWRNRVKELD
ncbi:DUF423 domain-containing protein [Shewanella sp. Choline-02u-19]|jgi:uncharacterized membrane protein YgdD (TMEM256/DUF423 family)|uniref:DUF423 domain-containing protein n=1 Tax=Shewanella TaxID=22 RepID=UPI000C345FE7|nr:MULTISPECIES: DUF423 domain-containing protein [Shewanella]MCL1057719.1 DUF423 domain-containing protein [Shewanella gelidimarina]PKG58300.1 DUF423 domain-containing protein [Shewanella sp. GutDb-MelDb]PKG75041.1 DUF423 domain-containing protein [Shewanella sp. GutCb]PKH54868.1 DUF423 domain-containing protein [Shewanella sp. Bg11-22]PKI26640.1 DUF423 domain-containing protein [Shewanella sp. Choline-02u-19]